MKIRVWLVTRERDTWILGAEVLALALLLFAAPAPLIRLWVGFPVLAHLGYRAMTSLPLGQVPGRPSGLARQRRNQHLRSRVVAFLNEVRRAENYSLQATSAGQIPGEVEANLRSAERRMMAAAAEVAKVTGRLGLEIDTRAERTRAARRPTRRTASP
ncbi:MAG: hypothetical protein WD995_04210 [Gemmatimonadota bacterium]